MVRDNIRELFVPYEQAKELIKLGFNDWCIGWYSSSKELFMESTGVSINSGLLLAPTYQQAFDFIRNKYLLHYPIMVDRNGLWFVHSFATLPFDNYKLAEFTCLKMLIEQAKLKKQKNG